MYIANVLQPLIDACQWVLEFWHDLIGDFPGSWGWSIILLTFTVRLFILPLTFKGVKSMQRLQQLQPEIKRIQARYKDDRQRMNQEVMAFYQREKVNPLGSCLPLVLQIPFFISLFSLLRSDSFQADISDNPGFLFIHDLADKVTDPFLLGVLIVLYVGTQLAASLVTAISADPTQRNIMLALPFVFAIFIVNFPAGLIVYWITTNVWTIGQQLAVKKLYPKPEPRELSDDDDDDKPARGKPSSARADGVAAAVDAKPQGERKPRGRAKAATEESGNGTAAVATPPNPRKKKKRSGRRR
jgi:YidC/Oxa1 family membrane protein insertase